MRNDSIETLLLRHYGHAAAVPGDLEARLLAATRREVLAQREQEQLAERLRVRRFNRRRAVSLVAMGAAGLGLLSIGLEGLQLLEVSMLGQDIAQPAIP